MPELAWLKVLSVRKQAASRSWWLLLWKVNLLLSFGLQLPVLYT